MQVMPKPSIIENVNTAIDKVDGNREAKGEERGNAVSPVAAKMIKALHSIKNTVFRPFFAVKNFARRCKKGVQTFRKHFIATRETAPAKRAAPARKETRASGNQALMDYIHDPASYIITPKNLLSSLTNDGRSDATYGKMVKDYLTANPRCSLFSSANISLEGDSLKFLTPLTLSAGLSGSQIGEIKIIELVIDKRGSPLGEFRGQNAKAVLSDKKLQFSNLAELCGKLTNNPDRNYMTMRAADMLASAMNALGAEQTARFIQRYPAIIDKLVEHDGESTGTYRPKFRYGRLGEPTLWNSAGRDEPTAFSSGAESSPAERRQAHDAGPDSRAEAESTVAAVIRKFNAGEREQVAVPEKIIQTHAGQNVRELRSRFEAQQTVIRPRK